jgi:hypothetical protein
MGNAGGLRKNPIQGVLLSEAKTLFSLSVQFTERFLASLGMTK